VDFAVPQRHQQRRHIHNQHWETRRRPSAEILPFAVSESEALEAFTHYHRNNMFGAMPTVSKVKATFVPFYAFDVHSTTKYTAKIRRKRIDVSVSRSGMREKPIMVEEEVQGSAHPVHYSADRPDMQLYASYEFKRDLVQVLKTPLEGVQKFEEIPSWHLKGRDFQAYQMHVNTAKQRISSTIAQLEHQRLREQLRESYEADDVVDLHVKCSQRFVYHCVYVPAYVIDYSCYGNFRTFVNGSTGELFARKHYRFRDILGITYTLLASVTGMAAVQQSDMLNRQFLVVALASLGLSSYLHLKPLFRRWQRERYVILIHVCIKPLCVKLCGSLLTLLVAIFYFILLHSG
jgi:hypothetical protein